MHGCRAGVLISKQIDNSDKNLSKDYQNKLINHFNNII